MSAHFGPYYGFSHASHTASQAWFHTREAAVRFADACGWEDVTIEENNNPAPPDVLDTPEKPWTLKTGL